MPWKTDYHIHTSFSDGKAAPEEYISAALAAGISEIGFSEHLSLFIDNQTWCMNPDNVQNYIGYINNLKKNDVAFELNTNGRNRPVADFYPDRRFLHIFKKENVPLCINSDAHFPARVGQFFDEAYALVKSAGFTEMAVFTSRKRSMTPLT